MTTIMKKESPVLQSLTGELAAALAAAAALAQEAAQAAAQGENDLAIGTLMSAERDIETLAPLLQAAFAIHRRRR